MKDVVKELFEKFAIKAALYLSAYDNNATEQQLKSPIIYIQLNYRTFIANYQKI